MEPTKEAEAGGFTVKAVVGPVVQIDEGRIQAFGRGGAVNGGRDAERAA